MINYIIGRLERFGDVMIIKNDLFGVQVNYGGNKSEGEFFLWGFMDQASHSFVYYAFDSIDQKVFFEFLVKVPGIGNKTAYYISSLPNDDIQKAIDDFDIKYFQALPGIGPKSAKRILLELKSNFSQNDMNKLNIDEKLLNDIVGTMKSLGYDTKKVKKLLFGCPIELDKQNLSKIIKRLMDNF